MIPQLTESQYDRIKGHEALLTKVRSGRYLTREELNFPPVLHEVYNEIYIKVNGKPFRETRNGCRSCSKPNFVVRLSRYYFDYKIKNRIK